MKRGTTFEAEWIAVLSELRRIPPERRFGQMMANLAVAAGRLDAGGVWDLEDDEALAAARDLLAKAECSQPAGG